MIHSSKQTLPAHTDTPTDLIRRRSASNRRTVATFKVNTEQINTSETSIRDVTHLTKNNINVIRT